MTINKILFKSINYWLMEHSCFLLKHSQIPTVMSSAITPIGVMT